MRIKVLRNSEGKVLATIDARENPLVNVEPVVGEGEKLLDMELRDDYEFDLVRSYKLIKEKMG